MSFQTREEVQDAEVIQDQDIPNHALDNEGDNLSATAGPQTLGKLARNLFGLIKLLGEKNRRKGSQKFHGPDLLLTGTITSVGNSVTGSGTLFTTELNVGDFIVASAGEYREVLSISDNTNLTLVKAFTVNIGVGQAFSRIQSLSERLDGLTVTAGFNQANTIPGVLATDPPRIESGSLMEANGNELNFTTTIVPGFSSDNYGSPNSNANNWYYLCVRGVGDISLHIATSSLIVGGLTVSSITNPGGATFRYLFSGAPDLSSPVAGDLFFVSGTTDAANSGVFVIAAVDNVTKYIEVNNSAGSVQGGAAGTGQAYLPIGQVSGGGPTVGIAVPRIGVAADGLVFDVNKKGLYSPFLTDYRILSVFYVNSTNDIEKIYDLGNGREWAEAEKVPIGHPQPQMIDHVPPWGIECDGAVVSRTTYNRLFARLGTLYGIGDGSTTFGLPDLRGMFLRGFDNGRGLDPDAGIRTALGSGSGGNSIATSQPAATNLLGHTHVNTVMVFTGGGVDHVAGGSNQQDAPGSTGGPNVTGNETRPVNTYTMYVMRY